MKLHANGHKIGTWPAISKVTNGRKQLAIVLPILVQLRLAFPASLSLPLLIFSQMSDSYSSRNGDVTPNGMANASNPSLPHNGLPSVIRKKLMGYVGFANLPNQVHRKSVRKGFQFTAMVVGALSSSHHFNFTFLSPFRFRFSLGESGLGKSTLINTLFNTTLYPPKEPLPPSAERPKTVAIESIGAGKFRVIFRSSFCSPSFSRIDIEENGVRLHLTVVDTPGFGDFVNNDDRSLAISRADSFY
jgi:septin 7